jgi:hypothetical protein
MPYRERMTKRAQQLTGDQLVERVKSLSRRLTKHLDGWDAGDHDAMEDVAGITRTLLAFGGGDKAILRLCSQEHLTVPRVTFTNRTSQEPGVLFTMGALPVDEATFVPPPGSFLQVETIGLREWLLAPAVISVMASRRITNWGQLVADYGNTYGAHLSSSVPDVLNQSEVFVGPDGTLGELALRSAAIVAERALSEVLPLVGGIGRIEPRSFHPTGAMLSYFEIRNIGGRTRARVTFKADHGGSVTLLRAPIEDHVLTIISHASPNGSHETTAEWELAAASDSNPK